MERKIWCSLAHTVHTAAARGDLKSRAFQRRHTYIFHILIIYFIYFSRHTYVSYISKISFIYLSNISYKFQSRVAGVGWLPAIAVGLLKSAYLQAGNFWLSMDLHTHKRVSSIWLSLKVLQKQDDYHWKPFKKSANRNNTKFCDKIAFIGAHSFHRGTWPFGERRSHGSATSVTLFQSNTQIYFHTLQSGKIVNMALNSGIQI